MPPLRCVRQPAIRNQNFVDELARRFVALRTVLGVQSLEGRATLSLRRGMGDEQLSFYTKYESLRENRAVRGDPFITFFAFSVCPTCLGPVRK